MLLKFSPSVPTNFRKLLEMKGCKFVLALVFATSVLELTWAQAPSPSQSPKPKRAYVRFWNLLPAQSPDVLQLTAGDKPVTTGVPGNFYANYLSLPPGPYTFNIRRTNDPNGSIKKVSFELKGDDFITIMVSNKTGQPDVAVVDDTIDPKVPVAGQLVLRQMFPNVKVTAFMGNAPVATGIGFGEIVTLPNVPMSQNTLTVQAIVPGQALKSWTVPVDLSQSHHDTLLIMPDSYGRFRPRLAVDGEVSVDTSRADGDPR